MYHRVTLSIALLTLIATQSAFAEDIACPSEFAEVQKAIESQIEHGTTPSIAVGVIKDGKLIWAQGFGHADVAGKTQATADTIYRLASVSKPITATGLMILKDRGLIDLDAPANNYLPHAKVRAYVGSADEITIRRLANHTAGFSIYYNFYYDGVPPASQEEAIARYGFAFREPGTAWEYCNLAFGILDYITASVAKTDWTTYMERELYDPLGMARTSDHIRPAYQSDAAVQYSRDAAGNYFPVSHYNFDHPGASAIVSTVNDLSRFAQMYLNNGELEGKRILAADTIQEMQKSTTSAERGEGGYGVGWGIGNYQGRRWIGHGGGMPGVSTMLRIYPDDNAATIVLTNCDGGLATTMLTGRLASALFPEKKDKPQDDKSAEAAKSQPTKRSAEWDCYGTWKGHMQLGDEQVPLEIRVRDRSTVRMKLGKSPEQTLAKPIFNSDGVSAEFNGWLNVHPGYHSPVRVRVRLLPHGNQLTGVAVAFGEGYFALPQPLELTKTENRPPVNAKRP